MDGPSSSSNQALPATSGAARKARERQARAQAKHVCWLASSFQTVAVHHTSSHGEVVGLLRAEVQLLKDALSNLQEKVAGLLTQVHAPTATACCTQVAEHEAVPRLLISCQA